MPNRISCIMCSSLRSLGILVLLLPLARVHAQGCYTAQEIVMAPGEFFSPHDINSDGIVAGEITSSPAGWDDEYCIWKNGAILVRLSSYYRSTASVVNENGVSGGTAQTSPGSGTTILRVNAVGTVESLGTIPVDYAWCDVIDINSQGSILGRYSEGSGSSTWNFFLYSDEGGMMYPPEVSSSIYPADLNNEGQVVGGMINSGAYTAFLYQDGAIENLGASLGLGDTSTALGIDDGGFVQLYTHTDDGDHQFLEYDGRNDMLSLIATLPIGPAPIADFSDEGNGYIVHIDSSGTPNATTWSRRGGITVHAVTDDVAALMGGPVKASGHSIHSCMMLPFYETEACLLDPVLGIVMIDSRIIGMEDPGQSRGLLISDAGHIIMEAWPVHYLLEAAAPGDADGDGLIGLADLLKVLSAWGPYPEGLPCGPDMNADEEVNMLDLLLVLSGWG